MHARSLPVLLLVWTSLLGPLLAGPFAGTAHSQGSKKHDPYEETISIAVSEFEQGNFAEARVQFAKAHAMQPTARTFRALGLVNFELRNYAEAAAMLETALNSAVKPLSSQHRSETAKLLERTRGYLGTVQLVLDPADTTVTLDGVQTTLDASSSLLLGVGEHTFSFGAPGRISVRQTVTIKGGQSETLRVTLPLVPDPQAVAAAAQTSETPPPTTPRSSERVDKPLYKKWWVWTAAGVVLAAAATTTALLATRDHQTKTEPSASPNTPPGATIQTLLQRGGAQ